ncbi:hypothetical protein [Streptomyces cacaoi]|uniref:hypothetical protein n=1 Tax=Streptomyces cacaoi TaxID=1898 RepID=UPI00262D83C2|nr:hypothetical protein [Streptomyces cacaoi]
MAHRLSVDTLGFLPALLIAGGAWLVGSGCLHAIRDSWVTRHGVALLSVLVLPLPFVLPFFGEVMKLLYLQSVFGIPTSAVDTEVYVMYAAGVYPALWCAGALLTGTGLVGWGRYFYWSLGGKFYESFVVTVIVVLFLFLALYGSFGDSINAAKKAASAARHEENPNQYFGLAGERVCVQPIAKSIPIHNGPLPTTRPLVVFDTTASEVWLWDPKTGKALHTPREKIATTEAQQGVGKCPASRSRG